MKVSEATRARRREASTGHQLPPAVANAILWDVILQTGDRVAGYPVVRFQGHYYLADGNPWPKFRQFCRLLARPDNPGGDLCITSDGLVSKWSTKPGRRWEQRREIVGVQDDVQPVVSLQGAR